MQAHLKIGLFGVGLQEYWGQYEGLQERLSGYVDLVAEKLSGIDNDIVNLGLVDTPDKAFAAGHQFRQSDVDIIFLYVTTYSLSSIVLTVVKRARVPVIVLNLSPAASINYEWFNNLNDRTKMTGEWLAYCSACSVPEIANVFNRSNIPFHQVTGMLQDDTETWNEIEEWIAAARVANIMAHNRMGVMGNYYSGMLDIYSNLTLQCATFGGHVEVIEVDELSKLSGEVDEGMIDSKLNAFSKTFDIDKDCPVEKLRVAGRTASALDLLISKYNLGSVAYYHKGTGLPANEATMQSIILGCSLLTAQGIPVAGEYEIKNAQAMKIMSSFGAGGSFSEFYGMDYKDNIVLMGHDGPCHPAIAEGKIKVRDLEVYHGKKGSGLSVEMSVRKGPATMLSVVETADNKIIFLVAEAESVEGPILEIGNTNSRYRFSIDAKAFVEKWNEYGPAHHCAIGVGHIGSKIKKLGKLIDIETMLVC